MKVYNKFLNFSYSIVSSSPRIGILSVALIIISLLSLTQTLPIDIPHNLNFLPYLGAGIIVGLIFKFIKEKYIFKCIFSGLIALASLYMGNILPINNGVSFLCLTVGSLGLIYSFYLLKLEMQVRNLKTVATELINNSKKKHHVYLNHPFEYSILHYEIDQQISQKSREDKRSILENLHKNVEILYPKVTFLLDCSFAISRLDTEVELEIVEINKKDIENNSQSLDHLAQAWNESFCVNDGEDYIHGNLARNHRIFVARNKFNSSELYGGLFVEEKSDGSLRMVALVKKANAIKLGMAKKIIQFLNLNTYQKQKKPIYTKVSSNNKVAIKLYKEIGFKIISTNYITGTCQMALTAST